MFKRNDFEEPYEITTKNEFKDLIDEYIEIVGEEDGDGRDMLLDSAISMLRALKTEPESLC